MTISELMRWFYNWRLGNRCMGRTRFDSRTGDRVTHGCGRAKGHAGLCKCSCGLSHPDAFGFRKDVPIGTV